MLYIAPTKPRVLVYSRAFTHVDVQNGVVGGGGARIKEGKKREEVCFKATQELTARYRVEQMEDVLERGWMW